MMYAKTHQRGGGANWARHLSNTKDNDHVRIVETRHLIPQNLRDMFRDIELTASAQCKKPFFIMEVCPAFDEPFAVADMLEAAERMEREFPELADNARVIIEHEKEGRVHWHITWSRIKDNGKAVCFKIPPAVVAARISYEMNRDRGTKQPAGLLDVIERRNNNKAPTLKEHRQADKKQLNITDIKDLVAKAWDRNHPDAEAIKKALFQGGFLIAKGDKRGLVLVHTTGEIFSLSRMAGIKSADVKNTFGDPAQFPDVEQVKTLLSHQMELVEKEPLFKQVAEVVTLEKQYTAERKKTALDALKELRIKQREERKWMVVLPEKNQAFILNRQREEMREISRSNAIYKDGARYKNLIVSAALLQAAFTHKIVNLPHYWNYICTRALKWVDTDSPLRAMTDNRIYNAEEIAERFKKAMRGFKLPVAFSKASGHETPLKKRKPLPQLKYTGKKYDVKPKCKYPPCKPHAYEPPKPLKEVDINKTLEARKVVFKRAEVVNTNTQPAKPRSVTTPNPSPAP